MSTPNINCILQAVIAAQNNLLSPSPQIATFDFGNPTYPATSMFFEPYFLATNSYVPPSLPGATIWGLAVQNTSASANLGISYTPSGATTQSINLGPGALFIYWDPSKPTTGTYYGITYFSLAAQSPATTCTASILMVT